MNTNEKDAVRTTIVGGRPPGSGRSTGTIPRGLEVLVKKAAVDPEFRELLFAQRGGAAASIELELDPAEHAMLGSIPQEQLAQIVSHTTVPVEQRRVFLGRLAVAMLAVIGGGLASCERAESAGVRPEPPSTDGIRPDRPTNAPPKLPPLPQPAGVRPDLPATNPPTTNQPYRVSPSHGLRPDWPADITNAPTRGIQPDRP